MVQHVVVATAFIGVIGLHAWLRWDRSVRAARQEAAKFKARALIQS